jgi:integron integrase
MAPPKLLDLVRRKIRLRHYSYRTEQAYVYWIKQFVVYSRRIHPRELGDEAVEQFLSHLAKDRHVSAATQNQALAALLFLYKYVIGRDVGELNATRAKRSRRLPTVLSTAEVDRLLSAMHGKHATMAGLLYGSGLRLRECLALRVKDLDFDYKQVVVRDGKGAKDRVTMLPGTLIQPLRRQLLTVRAILEEDETDGRPGVSLSTALHRKYPGAGLKWGWQYVFPSNRYSRDPRTGRLLRHHAYPSGIQKAVKAAARAAGISKRHRAIRSDTVLQRTFWSKAVIFEPSRSCSAIKTCGQP